ncbi:prolactin-releasing peptide receptor-like [Strongylocentrotus purpuratus]|uniref:G-protein coupled receptors family 1 profile domain-containing protein n=1 Tax=Strongylocentrotus purpuratus TaxID=7668 RepID=A0A7M7LPI1_STRPU|nr:prolactin-releasing peptide receptor-like [Strongylocentrotus purpuratus]
MARWINNSTALMTGVITVTTFMPYSTILEEDTTQTTNRQASDAAAVPWVWLPMEWPWWVIAQLFSAILGICGNLLVMLVLFNKRRARRSTDTLIGALAFADFLTSVFLIPHPQIATLPSDTWLAQVYCRIIHTSLIMWVAVVASVFTLTAISLERYLAIAHPFFFLRNVNSARTSMCIFIIWVAAIATNSYQVVVGYAAGNTCVIMFTSERAQFVLGLYVLPIIVMILAQIMTAVFLHRQSLQFQEGNSNNDRSNANMNHIVARKRVIQMLFLVTTVFVLCWGPDQIFFLMLNLSLLHISFVYGLVHRSLVVLAFVNSCANIFIYTIRYPQFRQAMCDMFRSDSKSRATLFGEVKAPRKSTRSSFNV